jgi:hypothetical protein
VYPKRFESASQPENDETSDEQERSSDGEYLPDDSSDETVSSTKNKEEELRPGTGLREDLNDLFEDQEEQRYAYLGELLKGADAGTNSFHFVYKGYYLKLQNAQKATRGKELADLLNAKVHGQYAVQVMIALAFFSFYPNAEGNMLTLADSIEKFQTDYKDLAGCIHLYTAALAGTMAKKVRF